MSFQRGGIMSYRHNFNDKHFKKGNYHPQSIAKFKTRTNAKIPSHMSTRKL